MVPKIAGVASKFHLHGLCWTPIETAPLIFAQHYGMAVLNVSCSACTSGLTGSRSRSQMKIRWQRRLPDWIDAGVGPSTDSVAALRAGGTWRRRQQQQQRHWQHWGRRHGGRLLLGLLAAPAATDHAGGPSDADLPRGRALVCTELTSAVHRVSAAAGLGRNMP